jgi:hypothetical protein
MKIHRQWKFVRKLRKSCGVKVWKLAEYFKVSEWIILRILTRRLFLNFRPVCARPRGLLAARCDIRRSIYCAATPVSVCGISHFRHSLQPNAKTVHQVWPVPITTTQFIIYYPNILPSFDIHHVSELHSGSLYNMRRGQRNSWISSIG